MPIIIRKIKNKDLYSVKNSITKEIYSKATTLDNALKQKHLLNMIENKNHKKSPQKMISPK